MADKEPEVKVVQRAGYVYDDKFTKDDKNRTPSAQTRFWANADDGRKGPDKPASTSDQVKAFEDYTDRPDIESRESIAARDCAKPAVFAGKEEKLTADAHTVKG